jgi:hypothetical protein
MRIFFHKWPVLLYASLSLLFTSSVSVAGNLEPSGPPAPTMKSLDDVTPVWSRKIDSPERYVPVLSNGAILDRETGLVWGIRPATSGDAVYTATWSQAVRTCPTWSTGTGRYGWRLPSDTEFFSIFSGYYLPDGYFDDALLKGVSLWTTSELPEDPTKVRVISISPVNGSWGYSYRDKTDSAAIWCVRGGR